MVVRKRILEVKLDSKTISAIASELSAGLTRRQELKDLPQIYRGGKIYPFGFEMAGAGGNRHRFKPFINGDPQRRLQVLGVMNAFTGTIGSENQWLIETSADVTNLANYTADPEIPPEEAWALNQNNVEVRKCVRTITPLFGGDIEYISLPYQLGLLSPGNGLAFEQTSSGLVTQTTQGAIFVRELPTNPT